MMNSDYARVADVILALEIALREVGLWEKTKPGAQALASQEPFCVDTLSFSQWLQFIFIVRIQFIIERSAQLPEKSDIAPMAEQYFGSGEPDARLIIGILRDFDQLMTGQST